MSFTRSILRSIGYVTGIALIVTLISPMTNSLAVPIPIPITTGTTMYTGQSLTVTGTGFNSVTSLDLEGSSPSCCFSQSLSISTFTINSDTSLTFTVPGESSFSQGATSVVWYIHAKNSLTEGSQTGQSRLVISVPAPAFTLSVPSETATVNIAISGYSITSTGGAIDSYSISPAISNTPGLSFSTSTGLITGTPTAVAASATYTITATNGTSPDAIRTFAITVNPVAYSAGTGSVLCGTSGYFTIASNEVTGHTSCIGTVVIPEGVTGIGNNAFIYAGVTTMSIPASVTAITSTPFNCTAGTLLSITVHADNLNFSSTDGVLFDKLKTELLLYPGSKAGVLYSIPSTVITLRSCSFAANKYLTSMAFPDTLVTLGNVAFLDAESLQTVTVGTGLNSWGTQSFTRNRLLTSFTIDVNNANFTSTDGIAYNKNKTTIVAYPIGKTSTSYTSPTSATTAEQALFVDSVNLLTVDLSSVATLDAQAFMGSAIKEVTLGNSLTSIPVQTFQNAMVLERVTFGTGLTSIDPNGFFNNFKLNCIIYPGSNPAIQTLVYPNNVIPVANSTLCPKSPAFTLSASSGTVIAGTAITSYTIDASAGGTVESYEISPEISNGTLSFSTTTGLLSGTPDTAASAATYTITARNAISPDATRTFSLTISALGPPSITLSTSTVTATAGTAITSYTIDSTAGGTVASYAISPAISNGTLAFSTTSGLLSGTPSAAAGARTYRITAQNATSQFAADFSLTINAAPVLTPTPTPTPTPVVVTGPPPSILKTITAPKISSDATHIFCLAGSFIFIRNGWTEETPKITSQRYLLIQDGKIVDIIESTKSQAIFEKKSSYLNTTLSCMMVVGQENLTSTASSMSPNLMLVAKESRKVELKRLDAKYYADGSAAYLKKSEEFAHIAEVKQAEISVAKTSAAILLASAKYQKAFTAASDLWKLELKKATTDRDAARAVAETTYLDSLEKSGVSIILRAVAPIVTPTATPTPTPTPTPTGTSNPQPTTQMSIAGTVYFETALYELSPEAKKKLRALATKINASSAKTILVYGHTDNRNGVNNTVLSQRRAKAVATYLRPLLTMKKISIGWYASKKPVAGGNSVAALAQNRRVEIYIK